jgi:exodeoxyribonuclease V alpha subunit
LTCAVSKIIQVTSVSPGRFGGAFVKGDAVGERTELRCRIDWRVTINTPRVGEFWRMTGEYYDDVLYGQQLRVAKCQPVKLPEESYVASLLAHHPAFEGFYFGQKKITDLIDGFGPGDLVKHLNDANICALSKVIQPAMAIKVVNSWHSLNNEVETINFLLSHRFSLELALKVIYLCPNNAIERLKANPYALVCFGDISRSIWRTIEACAKKLGISPDDENRLAAAIEYILYENLRCGHTAMPLLELLDAAEKLLKSRKRAEQGIHLSLARRAVCALNRGPELLLQLYGAAVIEMQLERRIENLISGSTQMLFFGKNEAQLKRLVDDYCSSESAAGFHFDQLQRAAIFMALNSCCSVLTGFPGTGKTTVLRAIIGIAKIMRREVHLLALAGKAKERARQTTGHRASTIHSFVCAVKNGAGRIDLDNNPLIIIDEASMVDVALFNELLSVFDGKPFSLLTVGDTEQISPVGFGLVLHRLVAVNDIHTVHLTEVYRQLSALHKVAMAVRGYISRDTGIEIPEWNGEDEGIFFLPAGKKELRKKLLLLKWLESKGKLPVAQILTPHMAERMPDSGAKINRYLQKELTGDHAGIRLGAHWLREGDPVIVSENNYDLGLFNGTTGELLRVETKDDMLTCVFTLEGHDGEVTLTTDELFKVGMKPAYAVSIHKSQGSEYDATIITCVTNSPMVERSLIYTALTRAKKLCLIVGSLEMFQMAVEKPSRAETLCVGFFLSRLRPEEP